MADGIARILVDESGNKVGVVLDGTIYRLQADAKIGKKSTDALSHIAVVDATEAAKMTLYTEEGDAIGFPAAAADPTGIVNDFVRQSGGVDNADLRVDGSTAPVDFTFDALGSEEGDLVVNDIGFAIIASGMTGGTGNFAGKAGFTNGIQILFSDGTTETQIGNLTINECLIHFASPGGYDFWVTSKDQVKSEYSPNGAIILHENTSDKIIVRIRDNVATQGVAYMKCLVKAVKRG